MICGHWWPMRGLYLGHVITAVSLDTVKRRLISRIKVISRAISEDQIDPINYNIFRYVWIFLFVTSADIMRQRKLSTRLMIRVSRRRPRNIPRAVSLNCKLKDGLGDWCSVLWVCDDNYNYNRLGLAGIIPQLTTNKRTVSGSCDHYWPIRGLYLGHVITVDQ